jgi:hypothetical protein
MPWILQTFCASMDACGVEHVVNITMQTGEVAVAQLRCGADLYLLSGALIETGNLHYC